MGDGSFWQRLSAWPGPVEKALSGLITGISPQMARELVQQAGLEGSESADALSEKETDGLRQALARLAKQLSSHAFALRIYYRNGEAVEFSALELGLYGQEDFVEFDSMSELLFSYYAERNSTSRIKQRSAELRHLVTQTMERDSRKRELMGKQLKDAEIIIPLDETLTPQENAAKYFERYQKLKRTQEATLVQMEETERELEYLRSVEQALEMAEGEEDLAAIKEELTDKGFEEAAALAAWYSSAPKEGKCEVDYTRRKEIKKGL